MTRGVRQLWWFGGLYLASLAVLALAAIMIRVALRFIA